MVTIIDMLMEERGKGNIIVGGRIQFVSYVTVVSMRTFAKI